MNELGPQGQKSGQVGLTLKVKKFGLVRFKTKPNSKSFLTFKGFFAGLLGPPAGDGRPPGPPPVRLPGTAPTAPARLPGTAPTAPRFSLSLIGCSSMIKSSSLMSSKPS